VRLHLDPSYQPKLTQKEVFARIRAIGMTVTMVHSTGEYRVNFPKSEGGTEESAYYTNDGLDAIGTAQAMKNAAGYRLRRG
jgi:hypothetical protein